MYSDNGKISARQLQILLILDILGVSIVVMPKFNAALLGGGGWLLVVGGGVFALISVSLMCALSGYLGENGYFDGLRGLVGRPFACVIAGGLVLKLCFALGCDLRIFGEAAKLWLLPSTPLWLICLITALPCVYGAFKGYEGRGRLGELLVFLILIPILIVYIPCLFKANYSAAFGNIGNMNYSRGIYFKGSLFNCFMFTGLEFLPLSFRYVKNPYGVKAGLLGAAAFAGLLAVVVNFGAINLLGAVAAECDFPGLEVMDIFMYSRGKGAVMMSFFYLSVVVFVTGCFFFGGELLGDMTGKRDMGLWKWAVGAFGLFLGLISKDLEELSKVGFCFNAVFGTAYYFIIPLGLCMIYKFKGDEEELEE